MASLPHRAETCIPCNRQFDDWDAYLRHMIISLRHPFACVICGQEFRSESGQMSHQRQVHAADQNLVCIGCGMSFTRCGSYVEHIEMNNCHVIRKEAFDKLRDVNDEYYKKRAKKQKARTVSDDLNDRSSAPTTLYSTEDRMTYFDSPTKATEFEEFKKKFPPLKVTKSGFSSTDTVNTADALDNYAVPPRHRGMTALTETLNNTGLKGNLTDTSAPKLTGPVFSGLTALNTVKDTGDASLQPDDFTLGKDASNTPLPAIPMRSPARLHQKFFGTPPEYAGAFNYRPSQPSNLRPSMLTRAGPDLSTILRTSNILQPFQEVKSNEPQKLVQASESTSSQAGLKYYHQYDPDQPGFNLEQYRNVYSKKYRCAFPGCTKLQNSSQALYMHLKSKAHLTDLSTCPVCLNQFQSASALFQHLESQTNKCNARNHPRFRQIVDQVAGGMIDTAGTHVDDSPRYYSTRVVPKLELHTVHEADEESIVDAVYDPEYRTARERERQQRLEEERARIAAWQNDDWAE